MIEYETHESGACLVLWRDTEKSKTDPCPFCGEQHIHGVGDGHRVAHCTPPPPGGKGKRYLDRVKKWNRIVLAPDGTVLYQEDSYVIKTRSPKAVA